MRKRIAIPLLLVGLLVCGYVSAQVKIGDNPQTIDPSSVLELESTERVLVITRVDSLQMANIAPSRGALVYNTSADCVFYYNGTNWINLCNGAAGGDFTTDAIANEGGIPTIVITPTATGNNFEVAPNSISSDQITNGSIFAEDLNLGALDGDLLVPNSITRGKLSENSIGPFAIDRDSLPLSFFENDAGFITGANIVSGDANNVITAGGDGGAFYDDSALQTAVTTNTNAIGAVDQSPTNELQNLSFDSGTRTISLSGNGGSVTLPTAADEVDGDIENELITAYTVTGTTLTLTEGGTTFDIDLNALEGLGDGGGNQNLGQVLTQGNDGGSLLIKNILNPVDDQDAATKSYVDGAISSGGVPLNDGNILVGDATGAAQSVALSGDATVDNAGVLTIENDAIDSDKIADATIGLSDLNQMGATDNQIMKWDDDAASWTIASGASHSGDPKSIFFADENGDPTQYFHPISGGASLIWDYEARVRNGVAYGALGIGLDGGLINNEVKVHIAEIIANDVAYPLEVHNRWDTPGSSSGSGVGILFASDRYADGKGAIVFERRADYGVGDFHFLQNANNTAREAPELATDKAFTITSEKNIQLYGDLIAKNGAATAVGQVLTNTANGTEWGPAGSVTGGETNTATNLGTGGVGPFISKNSADLQFRNINGAPSGIITVTDDGVENEIDLDIADSAIDATAKIEPAAALTPAADQMLITNAAGTVTWAPTSTGGGETNTATNLGTAGIGPFISKNSADLQFKNINGAPSGIITVTDDATENEIDLDIADSAIDATAKIEPAAALTPAADQMLITNAAGTVTWAPTSTGGGETNTATNLGTAGVGPFISKNSANLQFRNINGAPSGIITVTEDATENEIDLDIADGTIDPTTKLEPAAFLTPTSDQMLITNTLGNVVWAPASGLNLSTSNLTQTVADRTYDLDGGDLRIIGPGSMRIGPSTGTINNKLHVEGTIRAEGIRNTPGTLPSSVAYSFNGDSDTGMSLTDTDELTLITGGEEVIVINSFQNVGIGSSFATNSIAAKLHVDGNIWADGEVRASGVIIENDGSTVVPDYVFQKYFLGDSKLKVDYDFKTLEEIETFVKKHHHLPGIKSAAEVKKDGSWNLSESNLQNLEKIEELYLHTIEQEKKIDRLESEKETLSNELKALRTDLDEIKAMLKKSE